jgi:hypothetical protein
MEYGAVLTGNSLSIFGETLCQHAQRDPRIITHSSWTNQHSAIPQISAVFNNVVKTSNTNRYLVQTAHTTEDAVR